MQEIEDIKRQMEQLDQATRLVFPYAWLWFLLLLGIRTGVIMHRGYRMDLALAKGNPRRGILYSLTFSMLPWKKDSTRRHPWTYAAGMGMHVGLFLTILHAVGRRFWTWPQWTAALFALAAGIGFASALGLFVKRRRMSYLRPITNLDDYLSNLVVQFYLLTGCLAAIAPNAVGLWRLAAVLLLFYVPLGKIYHMLLFFVSRVLFGLQFGRRGVLQHDIPISY